MTTPCIEAPPSRVTFEELTAELKQHHVQNELLAIGIPGKWEVGFQIGVEGARVYPYLPKRKTLEEGYSQLLRWLRARQFNLNRYSDMDYQDSLHQGRNKIYVD